MRRATPGWSPWAWASIAGLLGFWAVSMFTQIKFPLNAPGVGDEGSLLARTGLSVHIHGGFDWVRGPSAVRGGIRQSQQKWQHPLDTVCRYRFGLCGGGIAPGVRNPQRARHSPGLAASRIDHFVPQLHRCRSFPLWMVLPWRPWDTAGIGSGVFTRFRILPPQPADPPAVTIRGSA